MVSKKFLADLSGHFLAPGAWVWFVSIPVLLILYLLRIKRSREIVSSNMLWRMAVAEAQADSLFQKLVSNWNLFLQILILITLSLAMMRPRQKGVDPGVQDLVLVIDASASMSTSDESPNRFSAARELMMRRIDGMPTHSRLALLVAGIRPRVLCGFTADRIRVRSLLAHLQVEHGPGDIMGTLAVARSLIERSGPETASGEPGASPRRSRLRSSGKILFATDGAGLDPTRLGDLVHSIDWVLVGSTGDNVGITRLDVRRIQGAGGTFEVFVRVHNWFPTTVHGEIELSLDDRLIDVRPLDLRPGADHDLVLKNQHPGPARVSVRYRPGDRFDLDNTGYAVLDAIEPVDFVILDRFEQVERVLHFLETGEPNGGGATPVRVRLIDPADRDDPSRWGLASNTVIIHRGPLPPSTPGGARFLIDPEPGSGLDVGDVFEAPYVLDQDRIHPLMRFIDLTSIKIARARKVSSVDGLSSILESDGGPLILAGEVGGYRALVLAFDPRYSDFPHQVEFPIFLANAVGWFSPSSESTRILKPGALVTVPALPGVQGDLTAPDGSTSTGVSKTGSLTLITRSILGFHDLDLTGPADKTRRLVYGVNLMDAGESSIRPLEVASLTHATGSTDPGARTVDRERTAELLVVALILLILEWTFFASGRSGRRPGGGGST